MFFLLIYGHFSWVSAHVEKHPLIFNTYKLPSKKLKLKKKYYKPYLNCFFFSKLPVYAHIYKAFYLYIPF